MKCYCCASLTDISLCGSLKTISIRAAAGSHVVLDAGASSRVLTITNSDIELSGLVLQRGAAERGAAIHSLNSNLTLFGCTVSAPVDGLVCSFVIAFRSSTTGLGTSAELCSQRPEVSFVCFARPSIITRQLVAERLPLEQMQQRVTSQAATFIRTLPSATVCSPLPLVVLCYCSQQHRYQTACSQET